MPQGVTCGIRPFSGKYGLICNLYNGFYYIRLIVHAAVHRVLDVIQIENICHNALQVYLAFSHCFNCQRIDVAVRCV